jgi:hypothetical protein
MQDLPGCHQFSVMSSDNRWPSSNLKPSSWDNGICDFSKENNFQYRLQISVILFRQIAVTFVS